MKMFGDLLQLSEKLHRERDHVSDVVRQEFADKLVATEEESKRVKQEMAELKSRHKIEIERMKQEVEVVNKSKQEEMDAVHARSVRQEIVLICRKRLSQVSTSVKVIGCL